MRFCWPSNQTDDGYARAIKQLYISRDKIVAMPFVSFGILSSSQIRFYRRWYPNTGLSKIISWSKTRGKSIENSSHLPQLKYFLFASNFKAPDRCGSFPLFPFSSPVTEKFAKLPNKLHRRNRPDPLFYSNGSVYLLWRKSTDYVWMCWVAWTYKNFILKWKGIWRKEWKNNIWLCENKIV